MTRLVVHLVDDDEGLRDSVTRLLRAHDYEVRAYESAGHFLAALPALEPGCLILDLHMPGPGGLELQAALERQATALPIIFLTGFADVDTSVRAMKGGAVDFLTKPVKPEVLLAAVEAALSREQAARGENERVAAARTLHATLTQREREVFDGVIAGRLNKQIGGDLGITERTVKAHRAQLMEKMGARSLTELLELAHLLRASR